MTKVNLSAALTLEHRDIDSGIETFVADLDVGVVDPDPAPAPAPLMLAFAALRRHIYLEEEFLFPPIREAGVLMPVLVMLREHGPLWQLMDALTQLIDSNESADIGDALLSSCRELLARLDEHNSKEEPIIYPHADTDLTETATTELAEFLKTGSIPSGWVCEAAR